jgi:hypothetical protein
MLPWSLTQSAAAHGAPPHPPSRHSCPSAQGKWLPYPVDWNYALEGQAAQLNYDTATDAPVCQGAFGDGIRACTSTGTCAAGASAGGGCAVV